MFLIREANALQGPAANALLKTLEEPPPRTHFVLATCAPEQLLPTIRSRCHRLVFANTTDDIVDVGEDADPELLEHIEDGAKQLIDALGSADPALRFTAAQAAGRDRTVALQALCFCAGQLRDQALVAARNDERARAQRLAQEANMLIQAERGLVEHNTHPQLTIEGVMETVRPLGSVHD